ncbi:MAG: D-2-hydroxyacid dehydrogenase [Cetobacterium sp.]|uniref:D-2-hydroxyacid dehydrogenase n=1 Tax=Cetobacterium sp. TaxID=2071632 RepID=UPI003F3FE7EF
MKIVVLDGYTLNPGDLCWDELKTLGEVVIYDRTSPEEVLERIGDSKIIFTNKTRIDKSVIDSCKNLKYIGVLAAGYNIVDVEYAREKGIVVTNTPGYSRKAVVQFVFALILEIAHHVWDHSLKVKSGEWQKRKDFCFWDYPLIELEGKTLGIVGAGNIGKENIPIAKAFGMNVLVYDRYSNKDSEKYRVELDELLKRSDIITFHCPLTIQTKELIREENILKMKNGVILINTSRGELVKESDVYKYLENGKIGYYAADVASTEPILDENILLKAKNCIITPHIAWAPKESRERLLKIAINNLKLYFSGESVNKVN